MTKSDAIDVSTPSAATHARYDEYEDSGLNWLGEIPAHWEVERLKWTITDCKNGYWGDSPEGDESDINTVRVADFDRFALRVPDQDFTVRSVPPEKRDGRVLEPGDLLLEKSGGGDKQPVGVVMLYDLDEPAVCSNFIARMPVADGHDPSFLRYLHGALYEAGLNERAIKQSIGIQNLDADYYLNQKVGLPPLNEQRAIAAYLDRETERIDTLIEKKERLIDLLEEKRTALISRVVTKGLDADVEMQDSGVEWLGEIPADWDTGKVGYLCRDVADGPHHSPDYVEGSEGIPFLSARHVKVDRWALDDDLKYISEEDYNEFCSRVTPEKGDVLYTKGGTTGIARVVDLDFRFHVWVHVAVLKPKTENVVPGYLAYSLNSKACYNQAQLFTRGATNNDLGLTRLIDIQLAVPSLSEQRTITKRLDEETAQIDALIKRVEDGVERLEEYRTTLISAAVTGQIDVREKVQF